LIAIKHVLVATDFSPASETALAYGRAFARTFGGRLHVLHVVENVYYTYALAGEGAIAPMIPGDLQREVESAARIELDRVVGEDDRRELRAVPVVVMGNSVAVEIVSYAKDKSVDVIVIGTHGRGALSHLLMGSVAEKVVRTAPCPVLTVRHPEHEFVIPDTLQRVNR
jgi:nucleotide-binding universal stress UspA family protein